MATPTPPPAQTPPNAAPAPQRYGRYILIDRLGTGGMAEVFRALVIGPEQFQRVVVVKRILPHLSENPNFVRMFIDEATLCGRLSHPNIIQVHEFGKVDNTYFIAMEYVQGRTMASILGRLAADGAQMPATIASEIARQACLGLGHAHSLTTVDGTPLKIIHRDVTPGNLMVAYNGGVKVLDFGIARVAGEAQESTTEAGQVKGKSAYFAPEQLKAGPIDGRVDIFALGIVLHEALTGRRLFKAANPLQTMQLIQEMPIPQPSKVNAAVPAQLDAIVMRALERDPEWRYRTAFEMAEALEGFLIEQRYPSQELPKFVRNLFNHEITQELALPPGELQALVSRVGTGEMSVTAEVGPPPRSFGDGDTPAIASVAAPPGRRRRMLVMAGVALAALLVAGVSLLGLRASAEKRAALAQRQQAQAAAAAAAAGPKAPDPLVRISLSSDPEAAAVLRDGLSEPLGVTPLTITLPRGREPVELRFVKSGFVTGALRVIPESDQPASITLAKSSATAASPKSGRADSARQKKVRNAIPIDPFAP